MIEFSKDGFLDEVNIILLLFFLNYLKVFMFADISSHLLIILAHLISHSYGAVKYCTRPKLQFVF